MIDAMPPAAAPLAGFAWLLRRHGFGTTYEQTKSFLAAIDLLGPSTFSSIHLAAYACFAPVPDRRSEFEALFRAHFYGLEIQTPPADSHETARRFEQTQPDGHQSAEVAGTSGHSATEGELLFARRFAPDDANDARRRLRSLIGQLPRRRCFRTRRAKRGQSIDLGRSLAHMLRHDGDLPKPVYRTRITRPRRILVLIDISGSMKSHTRHHLILGHLLARAAPGTQVFTVGTRLTDITKALCLRNESAALDAAAERVADWDGGTRLGPGFSEFTSVARYMNCARGSAVLVLSDGLERGDPRPLLLAVQRLRRVAWRLSWATPLKADPAFRPDTYALKQLLRHLDDLVDGGSLASLVDFLLRLSMPPNSEVNRWSRRGAAA